MPLYEYRCKACGHTFEKIQSFSAPDPSECPKCGGSPVERLLSAPAIQFKGSGFYLTDYGKTGGSAPKSEGNGGGAKAEGGAASSGDAGSKPASSSPAPSSSSTPSGS